MDVCGAIGLVYALVLSAESRLTYNACADPHERSCIEVPDLIWAERRRERCRGVGHVAKAGERRRRRHGWLHDDDNLLCSRWRQSTAE